MRKEIMQKYFDSYMNCSPDVLKQSISTYAEMYNYHFDNGNEKMKNSALTKLALAMCAKINRNIK